MHMFLHVKTLGGGFTIIWELISYLELRDGGNTLPFIPALFCYCKATFFYNCTVSYDISYVLFQPSVTFACAFHVRNFHT